MKRAIITGVTGQDGALLSNFLLNKGYEVFGVDRRTSSSTQWRLRELGLFDMAHFNVVSGDLTDASSISRLVQQIEPNEFYNLGAMSFVKESWNSPETTMKINALGNIIQDPIPIQEEQLKRFISLTPTPKSIDFSEQFIFKSFPTSGIKKSESFKKRFETFSRLSTPKILGDKFNINETLSCY